MRSVQMVQMMQNYSSLRLFKGWPVQKIFCLPLPQIQVSPMYPLRKRFVSDIPFFLLTGSSSNCAFSFVTRIRFFSFTHRMLSLSCSVFVRQIFFFPPYGLRHCHLKIFRETTKQFLILTAWCYCFLETRLDDTLLCFISEYHDVYLTFSCLYAAHNNICIIAQCNTRYWKSILFFYIQQHMWRSLI